MAFLTKTTQAIGFTTVILAGLFALLLSASVIAPSFANGCSEGAWAYHGCTWRGGDVSMQLNTLTFLSGIAGALFFFSGVSWLVTKCVTERTNPDLNFVRWWLIMFFVIVALVVLAERAMFSFVESG